MTEERDGSVYGLPEPDTSNLFIETQYPAHEDEDHHVMYRWFWDDEKNGNQAYCGKWRQSREEAYNEGVQWLKVGHIRYAGSAKTRV
jgi:hypothetical protein